MEWYIVLAILLLIILAVVLGVLLVCVLSGQRCTVSIQQRQPNHELTKIREEQERKRQKKFSTKLKRTFGASSKPTEPIAPVEDVKTVELTLKLGNSEKKTEGEPTSSSSPTTNEAARVLLPLNRVTQADLNERQKKRDEIRKKYNL